jgi:1-acyl-sn-glycerol-3-phosphate acyltransferase
MDALGVFALLIPVPKKLYFLFLFFRIWPQCQILFFGIEGEENLWKKKQVLFMA